jgi:hypothetical protein
MAIRSSDRNLPDWLTRVRTGQTRLPRFQRWEAWSYTNVALLFNTILQDLPAGSVLVLEIGDQEPFPSRLIEGAPEASERATEHLLDGQQRITALWRGLSNNYKNVLTFSISPRMKRQRRLTTSIQFHEAGEKTMTDAHHYGPTTPLDSGSVE